MASLKSWVKAARLRTLPLALASIIMGSFIAAKSSNFKVSVALMAGLTTLLLQILSNFANDYGDYVGGIDNENRVGPKRTVQTGEVTKSEMRKAMAIFAGFSLLSGLFLVFILAEVNFVGKLFLLIAGLAAIIAAVRYTVGDNPYGYRGLGDLNVFLFFGLAAVAGTFYLSTNTFNLNILLPASAMGLLSVAVLNLNNLRDHQNDRLNGKRTLVVAMGYSGALIYHASLVLFPFILLLIFSVIHNASYYQFGYLLLLPLFIVDLIEIFRSPGNAALDPFLKRHALKTLLLAVMFGILYIM